MGDASALAELKARITQDLAARGYSSWFWPTWNGVAGWDGKGPYCFTALNPSMGHFPSAADRLLYHHLTLHGFADAHLTDVVKVKATNKHAPAMVRDQDLMALHRAWFLEELQVVQPRLIVALGQVAHEVLQQWLPGDGRLRAIPHYAWAKRWGHEAEFAHAMAEMRAELDGITPVVGRSKGGS